MMTKPTQYLTGTQMAEAHLLWSQKKWDTLQIAVHLKLGRDGEHVVWRSLYERRDQWRRMRSAAKKIAAAS